MWYDYLFISDYLDPYAQKLIEILKRKISKIETVKLLKVYLNTIGYNNSNSLMKAILSQYYTISILVKISLKKSLFSAILLPYLKKLGVIVMYEANAVHFIWHKGGPFRTVD